MNQQEIELSANFVSIYAKLRALKTVLNVEQLEKYTKSVANEKDKFLEKCPNLTPELMEKVDKLFV